MLQLVIPCKKKKLSQDRSHICPVGMLDGSFPHPSKNNSIVVLVQSISILFIFSSFWFLFRSLQTIRCKSRWSCKVVWKRLTDCALHCHVGSSITSRKDVGGPVGRSLTPHSPSTQGCEACFSSELVTFVWFAIESAWVVLDGSQTVSEHQTMRKYDRVLLVVFLGVVASSLLPQLHPRQWKKLCKRCVSKCQKRRCGTEV